MLRTVLLQNQKNAPRPDQSDVVPVRNSPSSRSGTISTASNSERIFKIG